MFEVPSAMLARGRGVDPSFDDSEALYRRFPPEHFDHARMQVPIYAMELPDVSVNRSKHGGKSEFVLFDVVNERYLEHFGILRFLVRDVPKSLPSEKRTTEVRIVHEPLQRNYFHSEIQMHDSGRGHIQAIELEDEKAIARWRYEIRRKLTVIRKPQK